MRVLTLDEKITIKGILRKQGVPGDALIRLDTKQALYWWGRVCPGSIAKYWRML